MSDYGQFASVVNDNDADLLEPQQDGAPASSRAFCQSFPNEVARDPRVTAGVFVA